MIPVSAYEPHRTTTVYTGAIMPTHKAARRISGAKQIRRSVSLPPKIAKEVQTLARERATSDNRVLVDLIQQGIEVQREKEKAFFKLAGQFREAKDPGEVKQLGDALGRFVFGE
jgi:hypothetical protein